MDRTPHPTHTVSLQAVTAKLLVLSSGEEIVKRIESHLRNAGRAVRCAWVTDLEDLEDGIRRGAPDLVLCQDGQPRATIKDVLNLCHKLAPDLPVLLLATKSFTMAETVAALKTGARGLVFAGDALQLQHMEMICLRELGTHQHIKELRSMRAKLADYEARHERLMEETNDAVLHVQEGILTHANGAFATLLGHKSPDALIGTPLMDLVSGESQAEIKQFLKGFAQGKGKVPDKLALDLERAEGGPVKVTANVTVSQVEGDRLLELLIRSEASEKVVEKVVEVEKLVEKVVEVEKVVKVEVPAAPPPPPAASVAGRLELFQILEQAIKANVGMHRALVMVMVDAFGAIEERLGYQESEMALTQLTELLKQRMGPKEPVCRFSTALMAMVLSRPSTKEFEALAETLRQDVAAQVFKTANYEAQMTATVVCYPLGKLDKGSAVVDTTVREARQLSRDGGNRTAMLGAAAKAAQDAEVDQRKVEQIRKALQENRLKLAYQSIASLEGGETHHFDVLARMLDEAGQEVPAKDFIPAAEKHGLIVAIDRWVIAKSLNVLAKRAGAADTSSLFVRLSEMTVREGDALYKWLAEQVRLRPLRKGELVFTIQESIVENHISKAKAFAQALRQIGAEVAMDRFGSGSNSEKMLDHLTPNYVRFDYTYTKDFANEALQKRFGDLMDAAKKRKIATIVGQVEDANAMARLWQLGVKYIQGFHVQAPEAVLLATDVR